MSISSISSSAQDTSLIQQMIAQKKVPQAPNPSVTSPVPSPNSVAASPSTPAGDLTSIITSALSGLQNPIVTQYVAAGGNSTNTELGGNHTNIEQGGNHTNIELGNGVPPPNPVASNSSSASQGFGMRLMSDPPGLTVSQPAKASQGFEMKLMSDPPGPVVSQVSTSSQGFEMKLMSDPPSAPTPSTAIDSASGLAIDPAAAPTVTTAAPAANVASALSAWLKAQTS